MEKYNNNTTNRNKSRKQLTEELESLTLQLEQLQLQLTTVKDNLQRLDDSADDESNNNKESKWNPFNPNEKFTSGDQVVIVHSTKNRRQVGVYGTVIRTTEHFVWVLTEEDEEHQKHKRFVTSLKNFEEHKLFYYNHRA